LHFLYRFWEWVRPKRHLGKALFDVEIFVSRGWILDHLPILPIDHVSWSE